MKIYTKQGDEGQTSLIGGTQVAKCDHRIEAYGTVDELNSYLGFLIQTLPARCMKRDVLRRIQSQLFVIGSHLANDAKVSRMKLPQLPESEVVWLERTIDAMTERLAPLQSFILPGGSKGASVCHIARCICRRAERAVVAVSQQSPVAPIILVYLNRLSDFLFVLARYLNHHAKVQDVIWRPLAR